MLPLAVLVPVLLIPFLGSFLYFVVLAGHPAAATVYGGLKGLMVILALGSWLVWRSPPTPLAPPMPRRWLEGLALGLAMGGAILVLGLGPLRHVLDAAAPQIRAKVGEFGINGPLYILATFAISLFHSAFEEWYWRWFAFGWLRARLPPWSSHLLAGLAFALHHCVIASVFCGPWMGIPLGLAVGGAGIAWSLLYARHRSLSGAWIAHACSDLAVMYLGRVALG